MGGVTEMAFDWVQTSALWETKGLCNSGCFKKSSEEEPKPVRGFRE